MAQIFNLGSQLLDLTINWKKLLLENKNPQIRPWIWDLGLLLLWAIVEVKIGRTAEDLKLLRFPQHQFKCDCCAMWAYWLSVCGSKITMSHGISWFEVLQLSNAYGQVGVGCYNSLLYKCFEKLDISQGVIFWKLWIVLIVFFFFLVVKERLSSFNIWRPLLIIVLCHQRKTLIGF